MVMRATRETVETRVPPFLTVSEAAKLACVSRPHLYRLIQRGEVRAVQVGDGHGPLRIPADAFQRWLLGPPGDAQ